MSADPCLNLPFRQWGNNTAVSASTSTASGALARTRAQNAVITNPHASSVAFVKFGSSTVEATANDFPVGPGRQSIVQVPDDATHVAVILNASTATIYISVGDGNKIQ